MSLSLKTLAMILYKIVIKLISLKSLTLKAISFFGIMRTKVVLVFFLLTMPSLKYRQNTFNNSFLTISQHLWKKAKLNPSGLGALSLEHSDFFLNFFFKKSFQPTIHFLYNKTPIWHMDSMSLPINFRVFLVKIHHLLNLMIILHYATISPPVGHIMIFF